MQPSPSGKDRLWTEPLYRGHPEGLLGRARETRSPRQSEGRGGPFPSPPPGQPYPSPFGGEDLLPRVFELREEAEAVPLGGCSSHLSPPRPSGPQPFLCSPSCTSSPWPPGGLCYYAMDRAKGARSSESGFQLPLCHQPSSRPWRKVAAIPRSSALGPPLGVPRARLGSPPLRPSGAKQCPLRPDFSAGPVCPSSPPSTLGPF